MFLHNFSALHAIWQFAEQALINDHNANLQSYIPSDLITTCGID